jgi:hypothetical protein
MYSVVIAVCLLATPAKECVERTAVAWIIAPEHPDTLGACMRHGMLFAAGSNLVLRGSYVKVFCSTGQTAGLSAG